MSKQDYCEMAMAVYDRVRRAEARVAELERENAELRGELNRLKNDYH
jgi:hypothetical protein